MFFLLFINYLLYFSFCIIIYGLSVKIDFSHGDLCLRVACHKVAYAQKQRRNEDFYENNELRMPLLRRQAETVEWKFPHYDLRLLQQPIYAGG